MKQFFVSHSIAPIVTKRLQKTPLQEHYTVWKRTRISLAQKLDIIEASKKSGFSIEDVMKKYGLKKSTVYRLLAEKEKYTQQELNTPSSNRVKPVYSSKTPSKANIELEKRLMDWMVHREQTN